LAWHIANCYLDFTYKITEPLPNVHVMTRDKNGLNLKLWAHQMGQHKMEKMIDEFAEWHSLYELSLRLDMLSCITDLDLLNDIAISKFGDGEMALSAGKHLICFRTCWHQMTPTTIFFAIEHIVIALSHGGHCSELFWLLEVEPSLIMVTQ
jgi:hypothetical protein